jgi:hypothetical protein
MTTAEIKKVEIEMPVISVEASKDIVHPELDNNKSICFEENSSLFSFAALLYLDPLFKKGSTIVFIKYHFKVFSF